MYQKRNKELKVVELYLSDYKKQLYLREISKLAKIPLKTTQMTLSNLEKDRILKSSISGKNKYFRLNLDSVHTKFIIQQSEINRTLAFLEKYPLFKTFLKELNAQNPIIVFGSFARLEAKEASDIDLLIVSKEKGIPVHLLPNGVHEIELSRKNFVKALQIGETLIKEMQKSHVILNGHSFYVNAMWGFYGKQTA